MRKSNMHLIRIPKQEKMQEMHYSKSQTENFSKLFKNMKNT